jgi:hypothetical protein
MGYNPRLLTDTRACQSVSSLGAHTQSGALRARWVSPPLDALRGSLCARAALRTPSSARPTALTPPLCPCHGLPAVRCSVRPCMQLWLPRCVASGLSHCGWARCHVRRVRRTPSIAAGNTPTEAARAHAALTGQPPAAPSRSMRAAAQWRAHKDPWVFVCLCVPMARTAPATHTCAPSAQVPVLPCRRACRPRPLPPLPISSHTFALQCRAVPPGPPLSSARRPGSSKSRALGISPRGCGFVSHPEQFFRPSHAVKLTRPSSGIPL